MLQAARVQQSSAALVAQSPQLKAFVNKGLKAQLSGANTMGRHVSKARDSGTDIRIQDFQTVDLTGLSFSSETSYSHQVTEPHGVETPGFTQNSWASSMGVSLSKKPEVTLGALLMTTKNQLELNANQIDQLMTRDDRTNTIGALALYQPEGTSWVMTTVVTYGMHNYEGDRTWEQGLPSGDFVTTRALSSYNSYETYISSELGHRVRLDECSIFHPYMGWALSHETKLAYEEDATTVQDGTSSEYGLLVPKQSTTNLALHAGVEFVQIAKVLDMTYQVITKMGMTTQKNTGDYASYRYAYAGDPSVYHSVNSKNQRYNTLDLSFGIHAAITPNFYISGMYAGNYGKQGNTHTAMLNVEYAI